MSLNFFMSCRKNCYWVIWQSCTKNNGYVFRQYPFVQYSQFLSFRFYYHANAIQKFLVICFLYSCITPYAFFYAENFRALCTGISWIAMNSNLSVLIFSVVKTNINLILLSYFNQGRWGRLLTVLHFITKEHHFIA